MYVESHITDNKVKWKVKSQFKDKTIVIGPVYDPFLKTSVLKSNRVHYFMLWGFLPLNGCGQIFSLFFLSVIYT